jgi:GntR family transcriptional regulator/MocR family aminotransferase
MDLHINLIGRRNLSGEIYRQIRQAIADGRLRHGDCLPASRDLARSLQVSRTTVTVAYDRLAGEGYLDARVGAGSYVSGHFTEERTGDPAAAAKGVLQPAHIWDSIPLPHAFDAPAEFDFRTGLPDASLFPHTQWRRLMSRELRAQTVSAGVYEHPAGHQGLRASIARHIGVSRGVHAGADHITITSGAQQALDISARALLARGDLVAVEDPGYAPPRLLFMSLGVRVAGVPVDDQGIVVSALPQGARLVYVTPSHQYPLGVTMSMSRRLALLEWAARNNAAIIEDDYDSEFRFATRPVEPLQTLDTAGRVIYVGSFSKTLLPGLRLGFLVTPGGCTPAVQKAKYVTDWHTSMPLQGVLARFIDDGGFARHLRKVGRIYSERHKLITTILRRDFSNHLHIIPSVAGLHIAALARKASVEEISECGQRAATCGVQIPQLSRFSYESKPRAGFLFGFGAIPTADIEEGMQRLRGCLEN